MEREYTIYKLISPSRDCYIGYTSMPVEERWRHHVFRANVEKYNHPLYEAIRKCGDENFEVKVLETVNNVHSAQRLEKQYIASLPKEFLFNQSPGGLDDASYGGRIFWERLNADPVAREEYLKKLSDTKKSRDWTDYKALAQAGKRWRKENSKQAYKASHRALRIANRHNQKKNLNNKPGKDERPRKEKLMWKYKRGEAARRSTIRTWENRTEEERKIIGDKISEAKKEYWSNITDPKERSRLTENARKNIDREKQGAAASQGLKKFWEELKRDPERYSSYMAKRTKGLKETRKEGKE